MDKTAAGLDRKNVLLVPLDPVHDVGLKMIARQLTERGHLVTLLAPDLPVEDIVVRAQEVKPSVILVSRTISYGAGEMLARLVDMLDQAGIRKHTKIAAGGMAMRPELAAELGFDKGFPPRTEVEHAIAYVENREYVRQSKTSVHLKKADLTGGYTYEWKHDSIQRALDNLAREAIEWAAKRRSPATMRAEIRRQMLVPDSNRPKWVSEYTALCEPVIRATYERCEPVPRTRYMQDAEIASLLSERQAAEHTAATTQRNTVVFVQYGTGCPLMDVAHIRVAESYGARGVVHFDPSWGARREGLLEGNVTHEEDGTVITPENLAGISSGRQPYTLWQVRAHRGLNTPETVLLAAHHGADLTKINMAYGSLGAGTDPERLVVDGVECMRLAAESNLPYDVVTNEELCGVPAHKAFSSMLVVAYMGRLLGTSPILQPLFCFSPEVMVGGQMQDNYIDYNAAKIMALRSIVDAPIWPGAPVGFLTHTEDRVQSSVTTALHASLAASLGVEAVSIASSDEAYAGGPISAAARVDTLRATHEAMRFLGRATFEPTADAQKWALEMVERIELTLQNAAKTGSFVDCLYKGVFGDRHDGAYPGRAGRGTVSMR